MRRTSTALIPLLALLALVGCGPAPSGSPPIASPPATPSPPPTTPVPTPGDDDPAADPLDRVTRILLRNEVVYFGDEEGWGLDGFRYDAPYSEALAKLTAVFGAEPESSRADGVDGSASHSHRWPGFLLYYSTRPGVNHPMGVEVTRASTLGVSVETEHGVHVGTPMAEAAALADSTHVAMGESEDATEAWFDSVVLDDGRTRAIAAFGAGDRSGSVTALVGPIWASGY